jgi:hypothetical protein
LGFKFQELIESEVGEEAEVAFVQPGDPDGAFRGLQLQRDSREGAHEGGVHDGALPQIDDEGLVAAREHFLREILEGAAVLEAAPPADPDPDRALVETNLN